MGNTVNKEVVLYLKDKRMDYICDLHDIVVDASNISKLKFSKYKYNDIISRNMDFRGVCVQIPSDVNYATIGYSDKMNDSFDFKIHTAEGDTKQRLSVGNNENMQRIMFNKLNSFGGTVLMDTPCLLSDMFPQFGLLNSNYKKFMQNFDFANLYTHSAQDSSMRYIGHTKKTVNIENIVNNGLNIKDGSKTKQSQVGVDL